MLQEIVDGMSQDIVDTSPTGGFHGSGPLSRRGYDPLTINYSWITVTYKPMPQPWHVNSKLFGERWADQTPIGVVHGDRNYQLLTQRHD